MDNEKIILFMGRLVYEKGVQTLISAMPKILSHYHDSKLVIAGKGGMIDELRAQVNSLGLGNKVYFTGYLGSKDVQKMYKCSDVSVFPSTYEPFGIVALEAMLSGTPVVVSDIGGLNEIVEHGVNGMKSYAGNPNSLADSILALLFDDFLNHLKDGKFEESLVYLSDNESKEMYVKYIESLTSMDDLDDDTKKIYDVVKSKVMDFTYSIGESQDITDDRIKIKVTINNFNLYDAYKKTLQHILSEVIVDQDASNVSNTENISNLFIS